MIRINLLPFRATRKQENIRRQITIFISSFVLVFLVLFYYGGTLKGKIETLTANVENTKSEIARYREAVKEIEEIKKKLAVLNKKIEVIQTLEKGRRQSVRLLDNMSRLVISKRMWFTDFEEKGKGFTIRGIALDNKTVADFMTRLEGFYSGVTLKNLKQVKKKNVSLKAFTLPVKKHRPKRPPRAKKTNQNRIPQRHRVNRKNEKARDFHGSTRTIL